MEIDLINLPGFAETTAREAGSILLDYFGDLTHVRGKSTVNDLVSEADLASESLIIEKIQKRFPDHSIISEESPVIRGDAEFTWVVDPLDGTTNYIHRFPEFAVSLGIRYREQTVAGVVFNPVTGDCFTAYTGSGANLNGEPIHVSDTKRLSKSLLLTGFPYRHDDQWEKSFELFREFYRRSHGARRLGAASLDLCYLAAGRFDGFWEFNLKPWDICAGEFILRTAGGKTSDWHGYPIPPDGSRVLASNGKIHRQMTDIIALPEFDIFNRSKENP